MSRDERDEDTHTTPTTSTDGGPSDDGEDTRSILVELADWQFRKLRNGKEVHGRTWKGLLIDGLRYNECKEGSNDECE